MDSNLVYFFLICEDLHFLITFKCIGPSFQKSLTVTIDHLTHLISEATRMIKADGIGKIYFPLEYTILQPSHREDVDNSRKVYV